MKDKNFYTVQGWMINQLHLSGNELICYAIIHNFSQDGKSMYSGSISYLQSFMNVSKNTVLNTLKALVKRGLIEKHESLKDKTRVCYYSAIGLNDDEEEKGGAKIAPDNGTEIEPVCGAKIGLGGGAKIAPDINNNKDIDKENINKRVKERLSHKYNKDKELTDKEINFYVGMEENYPRIMKMDEPLLYRQYMALLAKGVAVEKIKHNLEAMENNKKIKERYSAYKTLLTYIRIDKNQYAPSIA